MPVPRLKGRQLLIVDDDEDIRSSIDMAMRAEGAETVLAADGGAAVSCLHSVRPDVIVLDMMLPRFSGFVVLEKIMESENPPAVVMITANQGKRHMAYAKALGVAAYLVKPVSLQRLIDTVADLLEANDGSGE